MAEDHASVGCGRMGSCVSPAPLCPDRSHHCAWPWLPTAPWVGPLFQVDKPLVELASHQSFIGGTLQQGSRLMPIAGSSPGGRGSWQVLTIKNTPPLPPRAKHEASGVLGRPGIVNAERRSLTCRGCQGEPPAGTAWGLHGPVFGSLSLSTTTDKYASASKSKVYRKGHTPRNSAEWRLAGAEGWGDRRGW